MRYTVLVSVDKMRQLSERLEQAADELLAEGRETLASVEIVLKLRDGTQRSIVRNGLGVVQKGDSIHH